tara:strand:- start:2758 stop:2982 length:225 start_codon:yes stop_codon:yes gene_type:complete
MLKSSKKTINVERTYGCGFDDLVIANKKKGFHKHSANIQKKRDQSIVFGKSWENIFRAFAKYIDRSLTNRKLLT